LQQVGFGFNVASNNSFKPTPLRSGKKLAKKACQLFPSTTPRGLTQALGCSWTVTLSAELQCAIA